MPPPQSQIPPSPIPNPKFPPPQSQIPNSLPSPRPQTPPPAALPWERRNLGDGKIPLWSSWERDSQTPTAAKTSGKKPKKNPKKPQKTPKKNPKNPKKTPKNPQKNQKKPQKSPKNPKNPPKTTTKNPPPRAGIGAGRIPGKRPGSGSAFPKHPKSSREREGGGEKFLPSQERGGKSLGKAGRSRSRSAPAWNADPEGAGGGKGCGAGRALPGYSKGKSRGENPDPREVRGRGGRSFSALAWSRGNSWILKFSLNIPKILLQKSLNFPIRSGSRSKSRGENPGEGNFGGAGEFLSSSLEHRKFQDPEIPFPGSRNSLQKSQIPIQKSLNFPYRAVPTVNPEGKIPIQGKEFWGGRSFSALPWSTGSSRIPKFPFQDS
ncbi:uncharacterized protein ACIQIH_019957 [Cyanocitta cristata]